MFLKKTIHDAIIKVAVAAAEMRTSGEIRVCVERKTPQGEAADVWQRQRALELFTALGVERTAARNGVLLYINLQARRLTVLADEGLNDLVPETFWQDVCKNVSACFERGYFNVGAALGVQMIGEKLAQVCPAPLFSSPNELEDSVAVVTDASSD